MLAFVSTAGLRLGRVVKRNRQRCGTLPICKLFELGERSTALLVPTLPDLKQYVKNFGGKKERRRRFAVMIIGFLLNALFGWIVGRWVQIILFHFIAFFPILAPLFSAARKNVELRRYPYAGIFTGRVEDIRIGDVLDVHVTDESGRSITVNVPNTSQNIDRLQCGLSAMTVVFSKKSSFRTISGATDLYIPELDEFIGKHPYLARDYFLKLVSEYTVD
uniref:Uncharacterized protein n=2 Tax=Rhodosorus marinus TaxID=101924 RepID=A0A7S3EJI8_9RHOD|mmetsp:Transcript_41314/g.162848  ORF Transcript_41314/g.162848 Transcript_41314/m.162848 type:complete len:219 (+) Transcript_41314:164-820(+)|eukprot:CAMPEP_0113955072 /NCGR_PEP_ID=MMETSP0011_2-20120614/1050_1 /TAXON_ID=101924 /ORGANISM="Rhodosorus marinus" /LENGTH=218 /DNA_ID=CAMNT_0000964561 /DNA_START=40 /DNA_END=696 /DNA_ORIENTATION=- /assembly_acc=CAM_ASM_000156